MSPRLTAQLGLGTTLTLIALSMATILVRPLFDKPVAFAEPGVPAPNFKLTDADGRSLALQDLRGQAVILYFTSLRSADCTNNQQRVEALAARYRNDARVRFIAINTDANINPLEVRVDAKISSRSFPTLLDDKQEVSTRYSITTLPQVAVIDPQGTLRYRGPFDDSAQQHYCADTVSMLLNNRELAVAFNEPPNESSRTR